LRKKTHEFVKFKRWQRFFYWNNFLLNCSKIKANGFYGSFPIWKVLLKVIASINIDITEVEKEPLHATKFTKFFFVFLLRKIYCHQINVASCFIGNAIKQIYVWRTSSPSLKLVILFTPLLCWEINIRDFFMHSKRSSQISERKIISQHYGRNKNTFRLSSSSELLISSAHIREGKLFLRLRTFFFLYVSVSILTLDIKGSDFATAKKDFILSFHTFLYDFLNTDEDISSNSCYLQSFLLKWKKLDFLSDLKSFPYQVFLLEFSYERGNMKLNQWKNKF
jgi:hypothetical protein